MFWPSPLRKLLMRFLQWPISTRVTLEASKWLTKVVRMTSSVPTYPYDPINHISLPIPCRVCRTPNFPKHFGLWRPSGKKKSAPRPSLANGQTLASEFVHLESAFWITFIFTIPRPVYVLIYLLIYFANLVSWNLPASPACLNSAQKPCIILLANWADRVVQCQLQQET